MVMNHPRLRSENFIAYMPGHVNGGFIFYFIFCTVFGRVSTHFPFFTREFLKTQDPGMVLKHPRFSKSCQIDLRIPGQGNFGVGITNPAS